MRILLPQPWCEQGSIYQNYTCRSYTYSLKPLLPFLNAHQLSPKTYAQAGPAGRRHVTVKRQRQTQTNGEDTNLDPSFTSEVDKHLCITYARADAVPLQA